MSAKASTRSKIPTRNPQPARSGARRQASPAGDGPRSRRTARPGALLRGDTRAATRDVGRVVVELKCGVTVYPARMAGGRWRAAWYENGQRRQCEAASEDRLAAKLEKVTERLAADAPNLEKPGADLIAFYLSPDRHPAGRAWSAKHADTQRRLCQRFAAPVIATITCQDIKTAHMQKIVNAAPTAGEGARLRRALSAMVTAGDRRRLPDLPAAARGALAARRPARPRPAGHPAGGIGAVRRPRPDPLRRRRRPARRGPGRRAARGPARADGLHRGLHRAAARRAVRPHHRPGRPGCPRHRRGPQGHRGRRPVAHRGAQRPQAPQDHLPRPAPRTATR